MTRFILLTFGFLGWAFYEMSGGADFEPRSAQMAAMNTGPAAEAAGQKAASADARPVVQKAAAQSAVVQKAVTKAAPVDTTPPGFDDAARETEVSRVSVDLTKVDKVQPSVSAVPVSQVTYVPVNPGNTISTENTPAIIPSLIVPNDTGRASGVVAEANGDIRSVSGNRVNVRGGPGTDYRVVSKLVQGDTVEVLEDGGDGWVRMRPLDGGPEGWMADFLLTTG